MQASSSTARELRSSSIEQEAAAMTAAVNDDEEMIEVSAGKRQKGGGGEAIIKPEFAALSAQEASGGKAEFRRIPVPPHRYTPLRKDWMRIYTPIVEHLKLDIRMNPRNRSVEIKTSAHTDDLDTLQKAADFVRAYLLGFDVADCVALLRVEDLFVDTFQVRRRPHRAAPPARGIAWRRARTLSADRIRFFRVVACR